MNIFKWISHEAEDVFGRKRYPHDAYFGHDKRYHSADFTLLTCLSMLRCRRCGMGPRLIILIILIYVVVSVSAYWTAWQYFLSVIHRESENPFDEYQGRDFADEKFGKLNQSLSFMDTRSSEVDILAQLEGLRRSLHDVSNSLGFFAADSTYKSIRIENLLRKVKRLENWQPPRTIDPPFLFRKGTADVPNVLYPLLPSTSVWCYGENRSNRICRFKNLYYYPKENAFVSVTSENSAIVNVPRAKDSALLDLTSVDDHGVFYFNYAEVAADFFKKINVKVVSKRTFLISRFHVANIMHTIHDDLLGLYSLIRQFSPSKSDESLPTFANFDLDHNIQFFDWHGEGPYGEIFKLLTNNPLRYRTDMNGKNQDCLTLFEDVIVGQGKLLNWYQYGFRVPQGPIPNKTVDGLLVRQFADFVRFRLGIYEGIGDAANDQTPDRIAIFSRRRNRLIANEMEVKSSLEKTFQLPVVILRMEEYSFEDLVRQLSKTKIAVGMHGSMLILGMFMPRGSILLEMYPFAVPAENYTPYKTMCRLSNMDIIYRSWTNTHPENNKAYPDRSQHEGGIKHLSAEEQAKVMETMTVPPHICCSNPYWLFRIYQDTVISISEIIPILREASVEAEKISSQRASQAIVIQPALINSESVRCTPVVKNGKLETVVVTWDRPWNGISVELYQLWEHIAYTNFVSKEPRVELPVEKYKNGDVLQIWIRWQKGDLLGQPSGRASCEIKY